MAKNIPLTRVHSYNVSVAADVGINAAVIFYNICYWVEENTANERNYINGEYWTYNTVSAFKELFPEMTYEQVRNALRKLEDNNYIKSAFLNEDTRDRTKWYTVVDTSKWIMTTKCNCENSQMENAEAPNDYNIYNNINNKTNKNRTDNKQTDKTYAFPKDKSFENVDDIYASSPDGQDSAPAKPNRYIPPDYSYEQLEEHVKPIYAERLKTVCGCDDADMPLAELLDITLEFYRLYERETGERHRVLSDKGYENIADSFMNPPDIMLCDMEYAFDVDCYMEMAELYFKTDYNRLGKYKGTVQKSLSHFMSSAVRENLFMRTQI